MRVYQPLYIYQYDYEDEMDNEMEEVGGSRVVEIDSGVNEEAEAHDSEEHNQKQETD